MSNNGYFGDGNNLVNEMASKYNEENELVEANEPDDFDAFNEETFADDGFGGGGEDWEAEHNKLMALDKDFDDSPITLNKSNFNKEETSNLSVNDFDHLQYILNSPQDAIKSSISVNSLMKNDPNQKMDSNLVQQLQLQQQQQQQQNMGFYQQQNQKFHNQLSNPQLNQQFNQSNKNFNQQSLNDIQLKLYHQLQFQQQLLNQMNQLKLQQQSQITSNLIKQQQQQIMQQIQYQQQVNANTIINLMNSKNNILQQQQQQQLSNQLNRKTPLHMDNLGSQLFGNNEKENYIQSKLSEMQLSEKNFPLNNLTLQQKLAVQQQQSNPFQMISFLQQQQQSSKSSESKLQITKNLPNAKTLEEIENELLNQPNCPTQKKESNENYKNQSVVCQQQRQQQIELTKIAPLLNMSQYHTQQNVSSNDLQNLRQLQQKQLLQAWINQQNSQQQTKFLQQQVASTQNQTLTNNLNNLLPSNFHFMNPQQKQQVISSLAQRSLNENHQQQKEISQVINNNLKIENLKFSDKLAGMMTDKEKNWVFNVQMMQLQINDPYAFDFYYTAWMLKKNAKQTDSTESNQKVSLENNSFKTSILIQSNQKHDHKNYKPLTFQNSLGKVTMSNFHHPRALIDINQKPSDQQNNQNYNQLISHIEQINEQDETKENKNICTILLEIEKMYKVYLEIDEIEHKILREPDEIRATLFTERRTKVDRLASLICCENFPHYLFVPKGKRLLGICLSSLNIPQIKQILEYLMQYLYIVSKNNIYLDEIYSQISYAIDTQKFTDLVQIVEQFVKLYSRQSNQVYKIIFSHKFGLTYLLKFVSMSELITQDDFDNEVKIIWSSFLNMFLNGLNLIEEDKMQNKWNLYEICSLNFATVLKNFNINIDLWNKNEIKLTQLFNQMTEDI